MKLCLENFLLFFLPETKIFIFLYFAVHYAPDPLNNLFDSAKRVDRSMHFPFQVQALLINDKSTLEQKALIFWVRTNIYFAASFSQSRSGMMIGSYLGGQIFI